MDSRKMMECIKELNALGIALSKDRNIPHLLELILVKAKELTGADAGTLFMVDEEGNLRFEVMRTDSLGFAMGGTSGKEIPFPPVQLHDEQGQPNMKQVAACTVLRDMPINIPDAYEATEFDFSGTRAFDEKTGYHSTSFLTVPMKNHEEKIIGVLELINAINPDSGKVVAFSDEDEQLAESLASQAAVALTNRQLLDEMRNLFESLIRLIATAIDAKSPYTGGHCNRVPVLTMMLADVVSAQADGPFAGFSLDEKERDALEVAAWLHDCGKVTTPEHIVDKATKLETVVDRISLVDARFAQLRREAELAHEYGRKAAGEADTERLAELDQKLSERLNQLEDDRLFLHRCNSGGEFMSEDHQQRVRRIATRTWRDVEGNEVPLLTEDEIENLMIEKGTLSPSEREIINNHSVMTYKMLKALPFPKHLSRVPEFAVAHHERMDGKGYPMGMTREQLSIQARMMAIADIFEALTAPDRPYKKAMSLSMAVKILGRMKLDNHIDPDLFDIFVREKIYERYASEYLKPEQIDEVDPSEIPGFQG